MDFQLFLAEIIKLTTFEAKLADRNVATMRILSRVDDLELGESLFNFLFDLLPVGFKLFAIFNLGCVGHNDGIVKIFLNKNHLAVLVVFVFFLLLFFLLSGFLITLLILRHNLLWKR